MLSCLSLNTYQCFELCIHVVVCLILLCVSNNQRICFANDVRRSDSRFMIVFEIQHNDLKVNQLSKYNSVFWGYIINMALLKLSFIAVCVC